MLVVFCSHLMEPPALSRAWRLFFANDQLDQLSVIDVKTLSDHGCRFPHQNPFSSWRIPCIVFFFFATTKVSVHDVRVSVAQSHAFLVSKQLPFHPRRDADEARSRMPTVRQTVRYRFAIGKFMLRRCSHREAHSFIQLVLYVNFSFAFHRQRI